MGIAMNLLKWLYRRTFRRYTTAVIITDRTPFTNADAWLPTLGDVLAKQDSRREP